MNAKVHAYTGTYSNTYTGTYNDTHTVNIMTLYRYL